MTRDKIDASTWIGVFVGMGNTIPPQLRAVNPGSVTASIYKHKLAHVEQHAAEILEAMLAGKRHRGFLTIGRRGGCRPVSTSASLRLTTPSRFSCKRSMVARPLGVLPIISKK